MLYGRDAERVRIAGLLEAARASRSGALVVRGAPGAGKTAILEDAREQAGDMQVLTARNVESESQLPFAGLHQVVRPALHLLERLPAPQSAALQGALGLAERAGDDRFLISVACLTLLSELAERRPVLCLVVELHSEGDRPFDRARTQLLLGEHLSGHDEHAASREHLRAAARAFEQIGAACWAERAHAELRAGGETAEAPDASALSQLTPQELQIARLVAEGHSNREVAARLFLSPRTIDAQLRDVFAKAGISSRFELAELGLGAEAPSGALHSRLARAGLAELFRDLRTMRGEALQAALARTLGDPELVVARRSEEHAGYADAEGDPVVLPTPGGDRAAAAIVLDGQEAAALIYDVSPDDDPELVEAICSAATIALENEQLHAESQGRLAELQASRRRIVAAGDAERRRLERNLHDGAQQRLVALALQLRLIRFDIRRDPSAAEALITSASEELAQSLEELRELARGIHPAALDRGLPPALDSLAARSTVPTALTCEIDERLPQPVELALYFVACEALANVGKYADATTASIHLWRTERGVAIEIADDGAGGADPTGGSGLRGLADRVEALNGLLLVTSPPGDGTVITADLPCAPLATGGRRLRPASAGH